MIFVQLVLSEAVVASLWYQQLLKVFSPVPSNCPSLSQAGILKRWLADLCPGSWHGFRGAVEVDSPGTTPAAGV